MNSLAIRLEGVNTISAPADRVCVRSLASGIILCCAIAVVAQLLSWLTAAPVMLIVLVLGIGLRPLLVSLVDISQAGIGFCAKTLLRAGIAMLGFRIVTNDLLSLGVSTIAIVICSLVATLLGGVVIARMLGQRSDVALITSTSVAVCGASAALAASSVVPKRQGLDHETAMIIIIVSVLSTLVMILYPLLTQALAFDPQSTAIILGAAIHDVAQVAGAGFAIAPTVGLDAVTVKMIRVACLLPVVFTIGALMLSNRSTGSRLSLHRLLPQFLIWFLIIAVLTNVGFIPQPVVELGSQSAGWALIISVAALGLRTRLSDIRSMRLNLVSTLVAQTLWQLSCVVFFLFLLR
jgi:uncharacterized integral membrane protein (TIGR00698 family)